MKQAKERNLLKTPQLSAHKHPVRQILSILAVQILIAGILCGLAEAALWLWFPFTLQPGVVDRVFTQETPGLKKRIRYTTGPVGERSRRPLTSDEASQEIRILCIGASTTQQPTQAFEDTWYGQLESAHAKSGRMEGKTVRTIGYGLGGIRAIDDLLWLQENGLRFKPDLVITLLGINDLSWNGGPTYRYTNLKHELAVRVYRRCGYGAEGFMTRHSQLFRRARFALSQFRARSGLTGRATVEWHSQSLPNLRELYRQYPAFPGTPRKPDPIHEFEEAVQGILDCLKQHRIPVILLGQPVLWKNGLPKEAQERLWFPVNTTAGLRRATPEWMHKEMKRYNQVQEQLARKAEAFYIDLDGEIPKTLNYFFDDCHLTDQGSRRLAEIITAPVTRIIDSVRQAN